MIARHKHVRVFFSTETRDSKSSVVYRKTVS